jgi:amino acid adenylation domain-containing protein
MQGVRRDRQTAAGTRTTSTTASGPREPDSELSPVALVSPQDSGHCRQALYWSRQLSGLPPVHNLPLDKARSAQSGLASAVCASRIDAATATAFEHLCRAEGATLLMGLHAAFALLVARHSGELDIVVGTPTSGAVGTLVLRTDLSQAPTFRQLLVQSRETLLQAEAHSSVRFPELLELLQVKLSESCTPLFQLMLTLQEGDDRSGPADTTRYDLTLHAVRTVEDLSLQWRYATDLFEEPTVVRLARHFVVLMGAIVAAPDEEAWRLPVFDNAERRQVLEEWNHTVAPFVESGLHHLFEAQARRTPNAVALTCGDARLSYVELNERANRLAHYLRAQGVGAQSLVGVCVERSPGMVVGLLAILKAGGAYVPLDPEYPQERLSFMLADSGAAWVLTQKRASVRLTERIAQIVLDDPVLEQALLSYPPNDPEPLSDHGTDALAYIIYTSGSTGVPKGVCIEHRNAAALIGWAQSVYGAATLSGVLAATSICFDLSVFELFVPLCSGGRAVIVDHALDIEGIANTQGVTLINTVPSAIKVLVEEGNLPASVRVVNLAGEALPGALVKDIYQRTSVEAVYNLYGPSEDTTYSTYALIGRDCVGAPPIGKPLSNKRVYVLDASRQPVPIGVAGEIYVGGAGVARGYWNRAELTAERFISNPLREEPGARLYKTGDLGLWSAKGELAFIGRIDNQIKLRGFRIELGEIQAQLLAMEGIDDALVMAREDTRGEKQLVAYVVPADTAVPTRVLVRACTTHLRAQLPGYMIPAVFMVLEALPLTPNGKVDRSALPVPLHESVPDYVAPASPLEEQLAQLWQEVLQLSTPVSATANFFDLGGQSLLATRMLGRMRQQHERAVSLKDLFAAPTLREFAQVVAQSSAAVLAPLCRISRGAQAPLSVAQQGLWVLDQIEDSSAQYHIPLRFLLEGELDTDALQSALQAVVRRHESLRTVVTLQGHTRVQRVLEAVETPLTHIDLQELPAPARALEVERLSHVDALAPFALDRDPMLRATLLRVAPARYELFLTLHHIAADGWSLDILLAEIGALYHAALEGRAAALPPLPLQYADYAMWQREWLQDEVLETHARYWMQQLSELPPVHSLPLDRPRPAELDLAGRVHHCHVDAATTQAFTRLCRESRATLFMGLHAVFSLLLARHSGETDIVVGVPIANRERAEFAPLIGYFVNTLVLRSRVERVSFLELLAQSEQTALDAYAHQQLPFDYLIERLRPDRSSSHAPIFQLMLALQNTEHAQLELPAVAVTVRPAPLILSPFELTLEVTEAAGGLALDWVFRSQLFDITTIQRMAGHFINLLQAVTAQPERDVWTLPMLGSAEQQQLLFDWNATATHFEPGLVHELFELQAQRMPNAIAIADESQQVSYRELARRANRCAHYLRARGVGPDTIVGICAEPSIDAAVAMLGTLKAGGAYLPLDGSSSQARINYMLAEAKVRIVLARTPWVGQLSASPVTVVLLCQPDIFDDYPDTPPDRMAVAVTTANLAYVIYTSGSTGKPKGVMNTHAGLANLCQWHAATFGTDSSSRCTLLANAGFDAAAWELWSTLLSGACAVPVSDTVRSTPHLLSELLQRERITHCFMPTGLLEVMSSVDALSSEHLRVLLCGGDKLTRHCLPPESKARLVNCYGPTEAAVVTTAYEVPRGGAVLIGKPIDNVQVYVLNIAQEPQPIGVVGELYIGGVGLARGYCNDDEQTLASFIPHPFSDNPQERLYKTGDFARVLANGNIEFIGRRDHQIKLRGFRVELGEIESRLVALPQVHAAAVMLREDVPGQRRLVGYVVTESDCPAGDATVAIREGLRRDLPEYMVPSALVLLQQLPLMPNGKLDRGLLPAPSAAHEALTDRGSETPSEARLGALWSQLLQLPGIGVETNFFEAGGNSLLVTRMIHAIAEQFQVRVTFKDVLRNPTIRSLAAMLHGGDKVAEPSLTRTAAGVATPLSLCQFRVWYIEQMRGRTNEHNMPVVLTLRGAVDVTLLERALNRVIARHDMLRTRFVLENGLPMQVTEASLEVTLASNDLTALPAPQIAARVAALGTERALRIFDICRLPLLSAAIVRVAEAEYSLQLNFHHLIFDGWSFAIFFDEWLRIYAAMAGTTESMSPMPSHAYTDFVRWQQRWMESSEAQAQAAFWRAYLEDCSEHLALPGQSGWPKDVRDVGTHVSARLESGVRQRLAALAQSKRGTLFSVLYSAFALLLGRLSGQCDLNIGIPVNGRHAPGTQGVIGNFLNNLPVRNRLIPQQPFSAYLHEQICNLEQVLSNQDYPFEKILELMPRMRTRDETPLFQVFFNMLSAPRGAPPQMFDVEREGVPNVEPKFDLTLYVDDGDAGIELLCQFDAKLFTSAAITHLLRQYLLLLEQVAQDPGRACGDYSLRPDSPGESRDNLEPQRYWPGAVQDIFLRRALERPDAVAIIEHDQEWTYGEVLYATTRLAKSLQQRGVGCGDVVGIVAARRACMVVGVLATLQTGAAFSLLNPEYPLERVCLLATIVEASCILFAGEKSAFAPELTARLQSLAPCHYIPAAKAPVLPDEVDFAPLPVAPDQLACVTFTSGTTGIPKAVAGTHIGISGYLSWVPRWLEISPADRFSMLSGLGHDPIQRDMFGPLCAGATLVIPQSEDIAPRLLAQWLKQNAVTFVHMTPAMAQVLCATDETHFPSLRVTFLTGEKLHSDAVAALLRYNGAMRVLNSYGTTETQRAVTYFEASAARDLRGVVPISEAAPDAVIRVLNDNGTPCGIGEVGSIFIESYALSKGYRNDPQLTSQVLTTLVDGRRRYRTGDIGCRRSDGTVMVLGRKDSQINIRGFRVEPGEIESQIRALDNVKDATVLSVHRSGGESVLVAYVAPTRYMPDDRVQCAEIFQRLKATLPAYMVPAAIVMLEHLPLTPNGKLDRRALPEPKWNDAADYAPPSNELEEALASIWIEVLRVERVGVHDDFFALGGHSVLKILLLTQIRKRLGVRFNITRILSCVTIREQAQVLASLGA